jgi:hypothetical protein
MASVQSFRVLRSRARFVLDVRTRFEVHIFCGRPDDVVDLVGILVILVAAYLFGGRVVAGEYVGRVRRAESGAYDSREVRGRRAV